MVIADDECRRRLVCLGVWFACLAEPEIRLSGLQFAPAGRGIRGIAGAGAERCARGQGACAIRPLPAGSAEGAGGAAGWPLGGVAAGGFSGGGKPLGVVDEHAG